MTFEAPENKIAVTVLFDTLLHSPDDCKDYVMQALKNIESKENIVLNFPDTFSLSSIKSQLTQQQHYLSLFPSVFASRSIETYYAANLKNRMGLKWAKLPYSTTHSNFIRLKTLSYTNLSLLLQMLLYLNEQDTSACYELSELKPSTTAKYLNEHLGNQYSNGQLIDFVDRLYDSYKHTNLPPASFRLLFQCFGSDTESVANTAFDYYMESRNTYEAWHTALSSFLEERICLPKEHARSIGDLLLN